MAIGGFDLRSGFKTGHRQSFSAGQPHDPLKWQMTGQSQARRRSHMSACTNETTKVRGGAMSSTGTPNRQLPSGG